MISPATILAPCSAVDAAALRDAFFVRLPSETTRETIRPSRPLGALLRVVSSVFIRRPSASLDPGPDGGLDLGQDVVLRRGRVDHDR
jgi:hypothetical protein